MERDEVGELDADDPYVDEPCMRPGTVHGCGMCDLCGYFGDYDYDIRTGA